MVPRDLTSGEWGALSVGLAKALRAAEARPCVVARAHPGARVAALWRGAVPVLTRGDQIWWPNAPPDFSAPGLERGMAVLQHELQHVLDYRDGWLTAFTYLTDPRHWTYRWSLEDAVWDELGAEQRASMAEQLWLIERGLAPAGELVALKKIIPWA